MNIRRLTFIWAMLFAVSGAFATEEVPTPHNITQLVRPLILQFYNSGGYTAWFRVSWTENEDSEDAYENKKYTSNNIAAGSTYTLEVPKTADLSTVRIEGFTNTGLLWDKYRTIFDETFVNGVDVYTYMSRDYYAIKTWGTTFSPHWAPIVPTMGVEGFMGQIDPYASDIGLCTRFTIGSGEYVLNNYCKLWTVDFFMSGPSGTATHRLKPEQQKTVWGDYKTFWIRPAN